MGEFWRAPKSQTPGAARAPKQCRDKRTVQGDKTGHSTDWLLAGAVGTPSLQRIGDLASNVLDSQAGILGSQCNVSGVNYFFAGALTRDFCYRRGVVAS